MHPLPLSPVNSHSDSHNPGGQDAGGQRAILSTGCGKESVKGRLLHTCLDEACLLRTREVGVGSSVHSTITLAGPGPRDGTSMAGALTCNAPCQPHCIGTGPCAGFRCDPLPQKHIGNKVEAISQDVPHQHGAGSRYSPVRPSVRTMVAMQCTGPWYAATALDLNPRLTEKTGGRLCQMTRQVRDWPAPGTTGSTVPSQHGSFIFTKLSVALGSLHQNSEAPGRSSGNLYTRSETR